MRVLRALSCAPEKSEEDKEKYSLMTKIPAQQKGGDGETYQDDNNLAVVVRCNDRLH